MELNILLCMLKEGVKQETVEILLDEELDSVELIAKVNDNLLKSCGLKAGQIARVRLAIEKFRINPKENQLLDIANEASPSSSQDQNNQYLFFEDLPSENSQIPQDSSLDLPATPDRPTRASSKRDKHLKNLPAATSLDALSAQPASSHLDQEQEKDWWTKFQLPTFFSPAVSEGLKAGRLSSSLRNEFTRDVCSMIRVHTMNPTKSEREYVCFQIVKKYPFLADTLGSGISSWQAAIKYRFKNIRKRKQVSPGNGAGSAAMVKPEFKKRKCKAVETENGETDDTCKEHVQKLKKEMSKLGHCNYGLISNLMEATYSYRRRNILENPVSISKVMQEYPALQLVSEIKAEFSRILGKEKIVRNMERAFKTMQSSIFSLAMAKGMLKDLNINNLIEEYPSRQSEIEGMASVLAIPLLLRETGTDSAIMKICSENKSIDQSIKQSTFPRLVGAGSLEDVDPLYIAAEGKIISKLSGSNVDVAVALALLIGIFYVFNIQYPNKSKNTYIFLESKMLQNKTKEANKRVIVQKLLKELE